MPGWLRKRALVWTTGAAASMFGLRFVTPAFVDMIFDVLTVGLVWLAASLARPES